MDPSLPPLMHIQGDLYSNTIIWVMFLRYYYLSYVFSNIIIWVSFLKYYYLSYVFSNIIIWVMFPQILLFELCFLKYYYLSYVFSNIIIWVMFSQILLFELCFLKYFYLSYVFSNIIIWVMLSVGIPNLVYSTDFSQMVYPLGIIEVHSGRKLHLNLFLANWNLTLWSLTRRIRFEDSWKTYESIFNACRHIQVDVLSIYMEPIDLCLHLWMCH